MGERTDAVGVRRLGEVLVERRVISPEVLAVVLAHQERRPRRRLGDLLRETGGVTREDIEWCLVVADDPEAVPLFCELAADEGLIPHDVIPRVLARQRLSGERVGEILVEMGLLEPLQVRTVRGRQRAIAARSLLAGPPAVPR